MKTIIKIIFFLILTNAYSQQSNNSDLEPFAGTWKWQNNNQTFKVHFYINNGYLKGNYELIETTGSGLSSTETLIYKSKILINTDLNFYFGPAISGGSLDGVLFTGYIRDNVLWTDGIHSTKDGIISIDIIDNSCLTCPTTAAWKVFSEGGIIIEGVTPINFTIPTDITLTKVN